MFNYNGISPKSMSVSSAKYSNLYIDRVVDIKFLVISKNIDVMSLSISVALQFLFLLSVLLFITYAVKRLFNLNLVLPTLQFLQYYDLYSTIFTYISCIFILFIFNLTGVIHFNLSTLVCIFGIYLQPVLLLPFFYIVIFSINSLLCLSFVQKSSLIGTAANDFITIISFALRFGSQYIRILLIVFVFILFYEYLTSIFSLNVSKSYINVSLKSALVAVLRIVFEAVDCFFILSMQFNIFFAVLIWLFSFLFIVKFNNIFEK